MKILKNFVTLFFCILICSLNFGVEANALFGNTHFRLGQEIIENSKISLSESEKKAFLSGIVYADIGRFKFDKEINMDSDSDRFIAEMKKHIQTSEEEWFVKGFEMHVLQDRETYKLLKDALGYKFHSYSGYVSACSLLDCYFFKKNNSYIFNNFLDKFNFDWINKSIDIKNLIPKDKTAKCINKEIIAGVLDKFYQSINKNPLVLYDELIKNTYHSLGLEVSNEDIYEQAANIVGVFALSTLISQDQEISTDLDSKIESACDRLVDLCVSNLISSESGKF